MSSDKRNPYMVLTVRCAGAGCTNVRGHANHWFVTSVEEGVFVCRAYSSRISLREHDEPVCGQACAQKVFEKWLQKSVDCGGSGDRVIGESPPSPGPPTTPVSAKQSNLGK